MDTQSFPVGYFIFDVFFILSGSAGESLVVFEHFIEKSALFGLFDLIADEGNNECDISEPFGAIF